MHSRYRHVIPAFALALTASCSPIAYIDFPDGGGTGGGSDGGLQSREIRFKLIEPITEHGPLPDKLKGMETVSCPGNIYANSKFEFKYSSRCANKSGIHQVICRYQPEVPGSADRLSSVNYSEIATLPYVIHSVGLPNTQLNTLQAIGTVAVRYRDPAKAGSETVQMVSITKPGAAVLESVTGPIHRGSETYSRRSSIRFEDNIKLSDVISIEISATVHCAVYREVSAGLCKYNAADEGSLLGADQIDPFSWKISGFSMDIIPK